MSAPGDGLVRAILGPTNTGKTHLAIERMCAHSSGVIGFPLRLLAREVYDRVVQLKGANQVALNHRRGTDRPSRRALRAVHGGEHAGHDGT